MALYGLIYEHSPSLSIKIFPAGEYENIDWKETSALRIQNFMFYSKKNASNEKTKEFIEYSEKSDYNILPLRLKETVRYKCRVESKDKADNYNFNPHLKNEDNKLLKIERDEKNSFTFQFINYLGKAAIIFNDGKKDCSFDFEIVPDKINYETDYVNLTQAIAEECSALLLEYSSPTSLSFSQDSEKQQKTALEQFIFLRQFCYADNIESLFASIKRNPDRILIEEDELKPFGQGLPSKRFFTNPFSHSRNWNDLGNGAFLPSEIAVTHKCESLDTPANRFLKFALNAFLEICENIIVYVEKSSVYYSEASKIKNHIENFFQDSFFDDVQDLTLMPVNNQALEKREGYSQIFNAFSMVDLALQLDWKGKEDIYSGESKNTALLYEYWLFFELRKIISKIEGCSPIIKNENDSFIKENDDLTISLCQDKKSVQHFKTENQKIDLYYNRTFSHKAFEKSKYEGSYSRPFRPDYTIAIYPKVYADENKAVEDGAVSYIHFDAKYRLEDLSQFINKEESETEINKEISEEKGDSVMNTYKCGDLLKMHTYNDAIRRSVGSYVLYPGIDNKDGKRFSVYEEILPGVGAFAIRPGDITNRELNAGEKAVKNFIKEVVEFNANPASRNARADYFEKMIAESPSESNSVDSTKNDSNLYMLGFMRSEYCDWLKQNHLVPLSADDSNFFQLDDGIYFYYHAIRDGYVYPLHKNIAKAKYFCASTTDFGTHKLISDLKIEPWVAEIESTELVSSETLALKLKEMNNGNGYIQQKSFKAQFYYLVHLRNIRAVNISSEKFTTIDSGNIAISSYSPKIVQATGESSLAEVISK